MRLDAPLMQLDQALDECEPDTQSALAAIEAALALHEELEHARQELGLDAAAVVLHGDGGEALAGHGGEPDAPAFTGVLGSVVQEVGDHLREAREVAEQPHRPRAHFDRKALLARIDHRAHRLDAVRDDLRELDRLLFQDDLALADARHV